MTTKPKKLVNIKKKSNLATPEINVSKIIIQETILLNVVHILFKIYI